jgi:hypothetical protein
MRNAKTIVSILFVNCAALAVAAPEDRPGEPDRICRMLFDEYVVGRGKINSSTRHAAEHIVAERGRTNGFWREVFRESQAREDTAQIACVRVLGKMLEVDALGRDAQRWEQTGKPLQGGVPSIHLGPEVVKDLIARGEKAGGARGDHYVTALTRARVPEARELFRRLVTEDPDLRGRESTRFHAAVGLAQLGDPAGFEWLIANADDSTHTVSGAWPRRVPSYNLDVCCMAALKELVGQDAPRTPLEWDSWWRQADKSQLAPRRVELVDD